jgi:multidrug transporter EmrE-like cation transporter
MSYVDILLLTFSEIIGDFGYKEFANKGGIQHFAAGVIGYIGVSICLIKSLQGSTVLLVNAAWDGISALVESMAAIVILGERFDDPTKYLGILFIIIGLFFLQMPIINKHKFILPRFFL